MKTNYSRTELYEAAVLESGDHMLSYRLHEAEAFIDDRLYKLQSVDAFIKFGSTNWGDPSFRHRIAG